MAFRVVSQRSTPHDRSELKVERPAQGAEPQLATITHAVVMVMSTPWVFDLDPRRMASI
jgi:hypothetical protein